jgi:very-short-patch-repair endonuclease
MPLPDAVTALVEQQLGLVTRRQLLAAGLPADTADGLLRRTAFVRVHRGVWRLRGAPPSSKQQLLAAVMRCGADARADGWATCWLLGLEGFDFRLGVLVPFPRQVTGTPFAVRSTVLPAADHAMVRPVPAVSAARAIIEVAPLVSDKRLRVGIDSARRLGLLSIERLEQRAAALRTLKGGRIVLAVIGSRMLEQESEGERALAGVLFDFEGLEWGVSDVVPGRRLDCFERSALLVIEYDGRDHHVLPTDRDEDALRDMEIESTTVDGVHLQVVRITKGMLDRSPERVRAFLRSRIETRRREVAALRAQTSATARR